ncbi:MAG: hypothetical protein ACJAVI_005777, partial [Candidatus Azotimanducaceae bacterium]
MSSKIAQDPRIDSRIKAIFGAIPASQASDDVDSREVLLAAANTEEAIAAREGMQAFLDM